LSPDVPQFPIGTQVALVRQLVVVADDGKPVPIQLTESVQLRTYREVLPREKDFEGPAEKAQGFVELELRRVDLFAARYIGTAGAHDVLHTLAKGGVQARLPREARASLERLAKRASPMP
jgi:hypothetical protein